MLLLQVLLRPKGQSDELRQGLVQLPQNAPERRDCGKIRIVGDIFNDASAIHDVWAALEEHMTSSLENFVASNTFVPRAAQENKGVAKISSRHSYYAYGSAG